MVFSALILFHCHLDFFCLLFFGQFVFRPFQLFIFFVQSKVKPKKNSEANFHTNHLNGHKIFTHEHLNQLIEYYPAKATSLWFNQIQHRFCFVKLTVPKKVISATCLDKPSAFCETIEQKNKTKQKYFYIKSIKKIQHC